MLGFLSRKSKSAWEPLNVQYETQQMHITVVDELTADNLCRMNNFNFGAATVSFNFFFAKTDRLKTEYDII